jgi:hypothetical protein
VGPLVCAMCRVVAAVGAVAVVDAIPHSPTHHTYLLSCPASRCVGPWCRSRLGQGTTPRRAAWATSRCRRADRCPR